MWISKTLSNSAVSRQPQTAYVTIGGNDIEVAASGVSRDVKSFTPYGYFCNMPQGEQVLLIPSGDGMGVVGTSDSDKSLDCGEVCIRSVGGAEIKLKNDGSVIINGTVYKG